MNGHKAEPTTGLIRWGILGCGDVTEVKSGPAFRKIAGSALMAVMRRDAGKARDYAQRHGVPRWYGKAGDLLDDPEIDAVYVASPPSSHFELGRLVAKAGKPCYAEKPMGASSADAQGLIDTFARVGLPLLPAFYRRGLPKFRKVRDLLNQNAFGMVERVQYHLASDAHLTCMNWRLDPVISGGGLFVDLGSHILDLFDFWFGPLELKSCLAENRSGRGQLADYVRASLASQRQSGIEIEFNFAHTGEPRDWFHIVGEKGSVAFAAFSPDPLQYDFAGVRSLSDENFCTEHVQQNLLENVMECLRGRAEPWATPEAALRTWKLMEGILKNNRAGG
ncbi:MAG TPA: Gfo/Idh/MocA family oxidoreductase [Candidatus Methylacidiphilales bacterium]|nr:Gfo/Idh/MocA family oxidoreductase [Candidatus Methylacidiphilales bacterium]